MGYVARHRAEFRHARGAWGVAAAVLTAVSAVVVALGMQSSASLAESSGTPAPPGFTSEVPARIIEREAPNARPEAVRPEALRIPAISVDTSLVDLGLNADDTVEVPRAATVAGWYDQGPVPGQIGSAVILGHVDSVEGPAVFYRLSELVAGDRVDVRVSDGSVSTFRVDRVATYDNEEFPAQQVYAGSPGRATLNLVTCGGVYDADRGGYQSNVVVSTKRVHTNS